MPVLHQSDENKHYYIKVFVHESKYPATYQVDRLGVKILREQGIEPGNSFKRYIFDYLQAQRLVWTNSQYIQDEIPGFTPDFVEDIHPPEIDNLPIETRIVFLQNKINTLETNEVRFYYYLLGRVYFTVPTHLDHQKGLEYISKALGYGNLGNERLVNIATWLLQTPDYPHEILFKALGRIDSSLLMATNREFIIKEVGVLLIRLTSGDNLKEIINLATKEKKANLVRLAVVGDRYIFTKKYLIKVLSLIASEYWYDFLAPAIELFTKNEEATEYSRLLVEQLLALKDFSPGSEFIINLYLSLLEEWKSQVDQKYLDVSKSFFFYAREAANFEAAELFFKLQIEKPQVKALCELLWDILPKEVASEIIHKELELAVLEDKRELAEAIILSILQYHGDTWTNEKKYPYYKKLYDLGYHYPKTLEMMDWHEKKKFNR